MGDRGIMIVGGVLSLHGDRENAWTKLDEPLQYMHFGEITYGVDERGEVGLLNRNIKVQASADAEQTYFGGHIMAMAGSRMNVSGIELTRMGQHLTLACYPIHCTNCFMSPLL